MPILNVKVSGRKDMALACKIQAMLADKTERILGKKRAVTAITIQFIEKDCWWIGGRLLSETDGNSFYLDIKITDETNTKNEKARYIEEVFAGFRDMLGSLHEESYIYVEDVRASSYGYAGKTQEFRFHQY